MPAEELRGELGFWAQAQCAPERPAIVEVDGTTVAYGQLLSTVNRLSHALVEAGVGKGGRVMVVSWNRTEVLEATLAACQIGAYFTLVNAHSSVAEVAYLIGDSRPGVIFVERGCRDLVDGACAAAQYAEASIVSLDRQVDVPYLREWAGSFPATAPAERTPGAAMLYTSGTSGRPKGVIKESTAETPEQAALNATKLLTRLGINFEDVVAPDGVHLVTSPLYHSAPIHNALLALHLGHKVVLMDRFDAQRSLELIAQHRVTWTHVVPTMMQRWMSLDAHVRQGLDLTSLRWLIHAAAPCPPDLKRAVIDWLGPVVYEYYSSTEVGGTAIGPHDWLAHPGSVGRAWPGVDVRILGEDGQMVPTGEVGTIYIRNNVPFTYHNDPEKTAEARSGQYVTVGDLGWLDEGGYLFLADRRVDLIVVGGVNVYPAEVEAVLLRHPAVSDVAVIGRPDPDLGQAVHAVIQAAAGVVTDDGLVASLRAHAMQELGSQKRPRTYDFVDALPRTDTGKLLRRVLRDRLSEGATTG
jgi:long-chain acyl-CoA synthetase